MYRLIWKPTSRGRLANNLRQLVEPALHSGTAARHAMVTEASVFDQFVADCAPIRLIPRAVFAASTG